jgi:hypothetical protein
MEVDVANPQSPATNNSDNEVDNIEKVFIENAEPGTYTIQVTHKGALLNGIQEFSLIADGQTSYNSFIKFLINDGFRFIKSSSKFLFFDLPSLRYLQSIMVLI